MGLHNCGVLIRGYGRCFFVSLSHEKNLKCSTIMHIELLSGHIKNGNENQEWPPFLYVTLHTLSSRCSGQCSSCGRDTGSGFRLRLGGSKLGAIYEKVNFLANPTWTPSRYFAVKSELFYIYFF